MPSKIKSIVVDASVARASSERPKSRALSCAMFLHAMRKRKKFAVFSKKLRAEWRKHKSRYATKWLSGMTARKLVKYVNDTLPELETKILETQSQDKAKDAMKKDFHLIEAALASDRTIVALDETVRNLFKTAAGTVSEIKIIVWGNPQIEEEKLLDWLQNGASSDKKRQLG